MLCIKALKSQLSRASQALLLSIADRFGKFSTER